MEYAKRSLRNVRDGTESSRSFGGEGASWSRLPGSAASTAPSKRPYSLRSSVVRRLWHDSSPKKNGNLKTLDITHDTGYSDSELENAPSSQAQSNLEINSRSIAHASGGQDSGAGSVEPTAGFQVSGRAARRSEGTEGSETDSVRPQLSADVGPKGKSVNEEAASSDPAFKSKGVSSDHNMKHQPHSQSSSTKRSWSSTAAVPDTGCPAGRTPRSPLPIQADDTVQNDTSYSGCSEDYFRLMAHIFNCIFR